VLKIMSTEEINAKRRDWAVAQLACAIDSAYSAAGVLTMMGADVRVDELLAIARKLETIQLAV
jgi:hypothetical protein